MMMLTNFSLFFFNFIKLVVTLNLTLDDLELYIYLNS